MDALILLGFLVAVAIAAPRWGYDSRDGFDSLEVARRHAWWPGRTGPSGRAVTCLAWLAPADRLPTRSLATCAIAAPAALTTGPLVAALD